jgi:hypothetical protein
MLRTFARNNTTMMAIILFMLVFGFIQMLQPAFFYNRDGSIREENLVLDIKIKQYCLYGYFQLF